MLNRICYGLALLMVVASAPLAYMYLNAKLPFSVTVYMIIYGALMAASATDWSKK